MLEEFQSQWATLEIGSHFTPPEEMTMRLSKFERKVRRRNAIEYLAGLFGISMFAFFAWTASQDGRLLEAAGWMVSIVGMVVVLTSMFYRAANLPNSPGLDGRNHLLAQLVHQRDALRSVGRWYLAPLIPGWLVVVTASAMHKADASSWISSFGIAALQFVILAGVFAFIWRLNLRAANRLDAQVRELDEMT